MSEFRNIKGYNGAFKVNILGQVLTSFGTIRKPSLSNSGYLCVNIHYNGSQKNHFIHRLIMMTFSDPIPGKEFINHIDGNKQNNEISNLEWCDRNHNMRHAYKTGLMQPAVMKKLGESEHARQVIQVGLNNHFIN